MGVRFYKHTYKGKYKFIKNWFDDRDGIDFEKQIDNWLLNFEADDEKELLLELLKRYTYLRGSEYKFAIRQLFLNFCEKYAEWKDYAHIFKVYKTQASYSDYMFQDFWTYNDIKGYCFQNVMDENLDISTLNQIVFVDDYIGTADTIINYIKELLIKKADIKDKQITILALYITEQARLNLEKYATENQLDLDYIYYKTGSKCFSEIYFDESTLEKIQSRYNTICENKNINLRFRLGYKETQSLVSVETNTPNNTLGIFWNKNAIYMPLFHRYTTLKKIKENTAHISEVKKTNCYTIKDAYFYLYCVDLKTKFNYQKVGEKFGLTPEQIALKLKYAVAKKYLVYADSKYSILPAYRKIFAKIKNRDEYKALCNEQLEETILKDESNYIPLNFEKKFKGYK